MTPFPGGPGHAAFTELAERHAVSEDVVREIWEAVTRLSRDALEPGHTITLDDDAPRPAATASADRYVDLGRIGIGGMGEVRRVRDRDLDRVVAMKIVRADRMTRPAVVARFVDEARIAAQLQHPAVAPVHELGRLPDGRWYFTMKEVDGRSLSDVIADLHAGSPEWTLRRLADVFASICDAVAYAHSRGVIHRDLKPDNAMVGAFGEVLVLDWGLAKPLAGAERIRETDDEPADDEPRAQTRAGSVLGTPVYMSPEQALGTGADARSDVYALGAILYEVLAGRPPYAGRVEDVLLRVRAGPPPPPGGPPDLEALCLACMARAPDERPGDAGVVATAVRDWLDGARREDHATRIVEQARTLDAEAARLREQAAREIAAGDALLAGVRPWEPEERKIAGWALQDEGARLAREAGLTELRAQALLHGALTHAPELPDAHLALVARYRHAHEAAEAARDADAAERATLQMTTHLERLPADHPVRQRTAAWLEGTGALTLVTDAEGATVTLHRFVLRDRRLVPEPVAELGRTPLAKVAVPMGSYLCVVRHPDRAEVRYPVSIGRGDHWDGVPPGATEPAPIYLPRQDELADDDVYVPAGWFDSGGDTLVTEPRPWRRVWCDGVVFKRFHVTNREYVAFLDDLVAQGREGEALAHAPRERSGQAGELGAMVYGRTDSGGFVLRVDADGDVWHEDWPVVQVDWYGACAYAAWLAQRTGQPWRLPLELEREKAARGVDGRYWPWGDRFDPAWCCMRDSHQGRPVPASVGAFPADVSVYGVRGVAGNAHEWCADVYRRGAPFFEGDRVWADPSPAATEVERRAIRGGVWMGSAGVARCANRTGVQPSYRVANLGLRPARSLPAQPWTGS